MSRFRKIPFEAGSYKRVTPGRHWLSQDVLRSGWGACLDGVRGIPAALQESFSYIHEFPNEIWPVFVLKFLESYSYFAVSQILVIYLHNEFGVSDIRAGAIYGMWGAIITLTGIMTSWVNDALGVRKATLIGFFMSFIAFMTLALTLSLDAVYMMIFFLLPLGESMGIPMLTVAIRRCTTQKNRGFAFGLYYSVMNIAALASGPVVDGFNIGLPAGAEVGSRVLSGNRFVILTCAGATFTSFLVSLFVLRDIKVIEADAALSQNEVTHNNIDPEQLAITRPVTVVSDSTTATLNPWDTCSSLCSSATFWRYAALTLLLVNLHAVFRHLDATLPTYLVRLYGDNVPKGLIYSINPLMIIFLTPLVAGLTSKYNHFNMIKYGGYVTGISPFFLVASTSIWAACMMVVFISLGEAIWSPRVYDYVMSIAPEGKEASFSALASAPLFAAKIPVGLMSGYLLAKYLPEDKSENRNPKLLWLYIGLLTISSPILITIFDRCIREPESSSPPKLKRQLSEEMNTSSSGNNFMLRELELISELAESEDDMTDASLDESRSLLYAASSKFPSLSARNKKKNRTDSDSVHISTLHPSQYAKYRSSRSSSMNSVEAEELCAVTNDLHENTKTHYDEHGEKDETKRRKDMVGPDRPGERVHFESSDSFDYI